jgi:peptidoglycan/LPS O-acetylase OafA/YrhL
VQGLRALAVAAVVLFHLAPNVLPGGFVGVDMFFVVSGYLITGQLAGVAGRAGRIRPVRFWARRARRLLPAAALVLALTWAAALAVLPASRLPTTADQVRASALYFQNWLLARQSVDYLASTNAPSPIEHFWSLSVEEQFYLVWPLLFLLAWLLARRTRSGRVQLNATRLVIAAVFVCSLCYSIVHTPAAPAPSYFITTTRAWELALGGALAVAPAAVRRVLDGRRWLGVLGIALIAVSLVVIDRGSTFPGAIALLPTTGTAALLLAGSAALPRGVSRLLGVAPLVRIGDLSYSLYLWHWPLIVLWLNYAGARTLSVPAMFAVAAVSLALSYLTKRFVEDPIRLAPRVTSSPRLSLATGAALAVPILAVALTAPPVLTHPPLDAAHPGAAALAAHSTRTQNAGSASLVPTPAAAPSDAAAFRPCEVLNDDSRSVHCHLGDTSHPRLKVALVGDSVVGQWQTAFEGIANRMHWKLVTDYKASCDWTATMTNKLGTSTPYTSCHDWGINVLHDLLDNVHPDVVITSGRAVYGTPQHPDADATSFAAIARGTAEYWRQLVAAGITVIALVETPEMGHNVPDCLSSIHGSVQACTVSRSDALAQDSPIRRAAALTGPGATVIDMNPLICRPTTCPPVIGNVLVYLDQHHLTETYTRTLQPYLRAKLLTVPAQDAANA